MSRDITVLVVDDDPGLVEGLTRTLPEGISVLGPVDDAEEAADRCRDGSVDLAVVVRRLDRRGPDVSNADRLASLTNRENEILLALCDGRSTNEAADTFGISRMTVQSHVKNILAKLGVHSKIEAVTLAWRHGLTGDARTAETRTA
jgi:two-component system nitrate/nitrite response regulator NarL